MAVRNYARTRAAVNKGLPIKQVVGHRKNDVMADTNATLNKLFRQLDPVFLNELDYRSSVYSQLRIEEPCIVLVIAGGGPQVEDRIARFDHVFNTAVTTQLMYRDGCILGVGFGHAPPRYRIGLYETADFSADTPAQLAMLLNEILIDEIRSPDVFQNHLSQRSNTTRRIAHGSK